MYMYGCTTLSIWNVDELFEDYFSVFVGGLHEEDGEICQNNFLVFVRISYFNVCACTCLPLS